MSAFNFDFKFEEVDIVPDENDNPYLPSYSGPAEFAGVTLLPTQVEYIERAYKQPSFLLGDDVGIGKTPGSLAEAITVIEDEEIPEPKILIIAQATCLEEPWEKWLRRMRPDFPITVVNSRKELEALPETYEWGAVIISWDLIYVRRAKGAPKPKKKLKSHTVNSPELLGIKWTYIIADEAHYAANRKSNRAIALKRLKTTYKRALTGTPVLNHPASLWSLLNWLYPNDFSSYWKFFERYVEYDEWSGYKRIIGPLEDMLPELHARIDFFYIRRTDKSDLPGKYYTVRPVVLDAKQQRAYDDMKAEAIAWVESQDHRLPIKAPTVVAKLTRLRQFASAYATIEYSNCNQCQGRGYYVETVPHTEEIPCEKCKGRGQLDKVRLQEPSSKLDAMMDIIYQTEGKVVVFSRSDQLITMAETRLTKAHISCVKVIGDTPNKERRPLVNEFQDGSARVFLGTIGAAGIGIDLFASSTVIFLDREWSVAKNHQAEGRLYRKGQNEHVQVILLQAKGTLDRLHEEQLQMKWTWIQKIMNMSREDIERISDE